MGLERTGRCWSTARSPLPSGDAVSSGDRRGCGQLPTGDPTNSLTEEGAGPRRRLPGSPGSEGSGAVRCCGPAAGGHRLQQQEVPSRPQGPREPPARGALHLFLTHQPTCAAAPRKTCTPCRWEAGPQAHRQPCEAAGSMAPRSRLTSEDTGAERPRAWPQVHRQGERSGSWPRAFPQKFK